MASEEKIEWNEESYMGSAEIIEAQLKALIGRDLYDPSAYYIIINDINDIFKEGLNIISNPDVYDSLLHGQGAN